MTQLDLPQVSLQRYFDLLKRRRWQVVPVSLLGLLVGGLVAFLIPRYFVAETELTYRSSPGDTVTAGARDPVALMVEAAKLTIPDAVSETLTKVGWPEASALGGLERVDYERALRQRVEVIDVNPGRERDFAKLHLTYKDRDGQRAKAFLDTLVATWVAQELKVMRDRAGARLSAANDEYQRASQAYEGCSTDLANLEQRFGMWPGNSALAEQDPSRAAQQQRQQLQQDVLALQSKQAALQLELRSLQEEIDRTPPRVEGTGSLNPLAIPDEEARAVAIKTLLLRKTVEELGPAHPARKAREEELAENEAALQLMLERLGLGGGQNPDLQRLRKQQQVQRLELEATTFKLEQAQEQLLAMADRLQQLSGAWDKHRTLTASLDTLSKARDAAQLEVNEARRVLGQLNNDDPIVRRLAWVPPAPTEPNILLVALIGCVIGLGVAIGLILAIDLLQGTFKTVDDVERGLSVPVLGGMSHLETEERKIKVAGSRKRASLFAGSFVVLTVVVVTWYYREPTSLPPFVRDLLSMVLGQG